MKLLQKNAYKNMNTHIATTGPLEIDLISFQ